MISSRLVYISSTIGVLTGHQHLLLVMASGDLGQHWLKSWLGAWWHQTITYPTADFSLVRFCSIHMRAFYKHMSKLLWPIMMFNITVFKITATCPRGTWINCLSCNNKKNIKNSNETLVLYLFAHHSTTPLWFLSHRRAGSPIFLFLVYVWPVLLAHSQPVCKNVSKSETVLGINEQLTAVHDVSSCRLHHD